APDVTLARGSRRPAYRGRAVPHPEKAPGLGVYPERVRSVVQRYFPLPAGSPPAALPPVAPRHPVFELPASRGQAGSRRAGARSIDPPRDRARGRPHPETDPRARGIRAPGAPDGSHRQPDSPPRLRPAALLRRADLPPRPHRDRLRALLLHVLDLRRPPDALP